MGNKIRFNYRCVEETMGFLFSCVNWSGRELKGETWRCWKWKEDKDTSGVKCYESVTGGNCNY